MDVEQEPVNTFIEIPVDALFVRQSSWAWIWPAFPWAVLASLSLIIDQITFGVFPLFLATVLVLPRYMSWRKTAYILTNDYLVIVQGSFSKSRRYDVPISQIGSIQVQPGFFGKSLGYFSVLLAIKDRGVISLTYTPQRSQLEERIQERMDTSSLPEREDVQ